MNTQHTNAFPFREPYYLTDGGLETTLVFNHGVELTHFAAFELLGHAIGRHMLVTYFRSYMDIARRHGAGFILETPTWRANADWGYRLGYDDDELRKMNAAAVQLLAALRNREKQPPSHVLISGCVGPREDGYAPGKKMSVREARRYHCPQIHALSRAGADLITALTIGYSEEAIGIAQAAEACGVPVVLSFTTETDGRLPGGETVREAIHAVDSVTRSYVTHYMINCAHPEHFIPSMEIGEEWTRRIGGVRANASLMSHDELDEAEQLDRGDSCRLAQGYEALMQRIPNLKVFGGCCGTDEEHLEQICKKLFGEGPCEREAGTIAA